MKRCDAYCHFALPWVIFAGLILPRLSHRHCRSLQYRFANCSPAGPLDLIGDCFGVVPAGASRPRDAPIVVPL